MIHLRCVAILVAVAFLCSGCGKDAAENKTASRKEPPAQASTASVRKENTDPALPVISATSVEFVEDHLDGLKDPNKHSKKAEAKYKGKTVELSGLITSFGRSLDKQAVIVLEGVKGQVLGPFCYMVDQAPWKKYAPGQRVNLRGRCTPIHGLPPTLVDCTVVEAGESPAPKLTAEQLAKEYTADSAAATKNYQKKYLILTGEVVAKDGKAFDIELKGDGKTKIHCNVSTPSENDLVKGLKIGDKVRFVGMFAFDSRGEVGISDCWPMDPP